MRFGLSPAAFWALSLIEWLWLVDDVFGGAHEVMRKSSLQSLVQQYPDKKL